MRKYRDAKKVLPAELFEQVQSHVSGCYLWVRTDWKEEQRRRNDCIARMYFDEGMCVKDIARMVYLSPSRVWGIIAEWRKLHADDV